ncbi:protein tweety homolog 1-like [Pristis pectinata]|uniref:protein tweety homolog 1-like n=1 Tax=Pristis pectinata TaxID=685728 RepID=UPI00223C8DB7|nr:protein tweety homolog 1-like [Pristis pectinata]
MGQAARSLVAVNRTLADVEFLVSNSSATLSQVVREDLTQLEEIFSERPEFLLPTRNTRRKAEALLVHLRGLLFGRGLGFRLLELAEWGDRVEKARWPSYLALLLSDAFLCLGTLPLLAGRARCPLLWVTALAALALVLSWLCLGVEFAAALALSDLCVQPEVYVLNTSQWEQVLSSEILEYYVRCDGTVPNPFQQRLTLSQRAMSEIHHQLLSVLRGSAAELPSAQPRLLSVLRALNASEGMFHHLAVRLHCLSSHKHLRDVWTGLCWDGLDGVLGLSLFSLLTSASLSLLAGCLPRVWGARTAGTRVPPREETERTEEEEDVFRPPEWSQLPRYLSRPRLHTFSNYSRPSLRPPPNSRPRTPTLHYM